MADKHDHDATNPVHLALFLLGGACVGSGLIALYFSFGWEGGPLNSDFAEVGYSGFDNIAMLPGADFVAIPLLVVGLFSLVFANATAWRETGGY